LLALTLLTLLALALLTLTLLARALLALTLLTVACGPHHRPPGRGRRRGSGVADLWPAHQCLFSRCRRRTTLAHRLGQLQRVDGCGADTSVDITGVDVAVGCIIVVDIIVVDIARCAAACSRAFATFAATRAAATLLGCGPDRGVAQIVVARRLSRGLSSRRIGRGARRLVVPGPVGPRGIGDGVVHGTDPFWRACRSAGRDDAAAGQGCHWPHWRRW
jgi:hypothetical protein